MKTGPELPDFVPTLVQGKEDVELKIMVIYDWTPDTCEKCKLLGHSTACCSASSSTSGDEMNAPTSASISKEEFIRGNLSVETVSEASSQVVTVDKSISNREKGKEMMYESYERLKINPR